MRRKEYAPYFQDNWKPTRRLTLNLGLRWEYRTPVYERTGSMMGFDLNQKAYVIGTDLRPFEALGNTLPSIVAGVQSYGGKIITAQRPDCRRTWSITTGRTSGRGWASRTGRWTAAKSFVVRGGYRISYYTEPISNWFNSQSAAQLVSANFVNSVSEYGGVAGRPAELWPAERAAVYRRSEYRQQRHRYQRHADAPEGI